MDGISPNEMRAIRARATDPEITLAAIDRGKLLAEVDRLQAEVVHWRNNALNAESKSMRATAEVTRFRAGVEELRNAVRFGIRFNTDEATVDALHTIFDDLNRILSPEAGHEDQD